MGNTLKTVIDRLGEHSTWLGAALLAFLSARFGPQGAEIIMEAIAALLSAIAIIVPEKTVGKPPADSR
ncbi:MAG: hypothetical protein WC130_10660 [Kiritimatiellia bacterium]